MQKISTGEIKLPALQGMQDKDLVTAWALLDAGSAVNVVDVAKMFQGIKIRESSARRKGGGSSTSPRKAARFKTEEKGRCIIRP